jgi:hypothetical protein
MEEFYSLYFLLIFSMLISLCDIWTNNVRQVIENIKR